MRIDIETANEDQLSRTEFEFDLATPIGMGEMKLTLFGYTEQSRPSKRHNWRTDRRYSRLDSRGCSITLEEVPLTAEITARAKAQIKELVDAMKVIV